jgi:hypothetical protein
VIKSQTRPGNGDKSGGRAGVAYFRLDTARDPGGAAGFTYFRKGGALDTIFINITAAVGFNI